MDLIIVGGGCIGLGLAGELAQSHTVRLFEKDKCGRGASYAAAGMIAPIMEAEYGEDELRRLGLRSQELYTEFVSDLEEETDCSVDYRTDGTLTVAFDQSGEAELDRKVDYLRGIGLDVESLTADEARSLEPRLSSYVTSAYRISSESQVDNRQLVEALLDRCRKRGVNVREEEPVQRMVYNGDTIDEIKTAEDTYEADLVILCAGAYSAEIDGLKNSDRMPVRPVKGEALSVGLGDPLEVNHVVRSPDVYCVPKDDGRLVIGGTMEEKGFDRTVTAGGVLSLLHEAYEVLPFIYEKELLETWAGLRPASRDSLPILGPSSVTDNLAFATGHYRNGILLTPVTIQLMVEWIESGDYPELMRPFLPSRFQEV